MHRTAKDTTPDGPTRGQMLEELVDLSAGLGVMLLPALILAVPGIILFVVLPGLLLLPIAIAGAIVIGPPYLVLRWIRRRGDRSRLRGSGAGRVEQGRGLGARAGAELAARRGHVRVDGGHGDSQPGRDVGAAKAGPHQREHLALAGREGVAHTAAGGR
jgi:hypothetical protein